MSAHRREPLGARTPAHAPGVHAVDFALVRQRAVDAVGHPREDLFMVMEDIEYGLRLTRAGLGVGVLARDLMQRGKLGPHSGRSGAALWRRYCKTRNHVRIALEGRTLEPAGD